MATIMLIGLNRHCSALSKAREIVSQIASLDGVRGVLRLAGPDIIGFLQVMLQHYPAPHLSTDELLEMAYPIIAGSADK